MKYKITIEKTSIKEIPAGRDWERGAGPDDDYGYTPEIMKKKEVTEQIYIQESDELDLVEVIKAVNNIIA